MSISELYKVYLAHPDITTDSRQCPHGSIFFALKGERFDGNQYAEDVLANGCSYAVVDDPTVVPHNHTEQYILVSNVLETLQQLAAYHRRQLNIPVVGITGTNGKTTTKELINAVLSQRYRVLATEGNYNNQIGVPLTLLRIKDEHQIAIIEMGANHPMDIAELCEIVHPDFGLITNVGKAHLMGFRSLEGVVDAKTKLYESLRASNGTVFVDAGNSLLLPKVDGIRQIQYGCGADVNGEVVSCAPYLQLKLNVKGASVSVSTHLIGSYNLINVLAAAAVGNHFGISSQQIKIAVENYQPKNMRSQLIDLGHGNKLILDAYNANPTSMAAALNSFASNSEEHKNLILGDMRELGEESAHEHYQILQMIINQNVTYDSVLLVGQEFTSAFMQLPDAGLHALAQHTSRCYADVEALKHDASAWSNLCGTTLIKGSRGIRLEQILTVLQN